MNEAQKDNVRKLVEALRTTEVGQTKGYLNIVSSTCGHVKVGMCCLGVACSIVPGLIQQRETGYCTMCEAEYTFISYDGAYGLLPEAAQQFYDLPNSPNIRRSGDEFRTMQAIMANDTYNYTFTEIAQGFQDHYLS